MKRLLLLSVLLLSGCSLSTHVPTPNLATQMVSNYPELQHICDFAGGCQNVTITCTRYDNKGNSNLRNLTFWMIETGGVETKDEVEGVWSSSNDHLDNHCLD